LVTVKCLLIYPNPESALDEEAGKLLLEDYESYCERARLITSVHATPRVKPVEFAAPTQPKREVAGSSKTVPPAAVIPPKSAVTSTTPSTIQRKSSPRPEPQPLQSTASNTPSILQSTTSKKENHVSPSPLSTADANVDGNPKSTGIITGGNKAVKRSAAATGGTGAEKRKKALKRL
jgi:ubiquitin-conjugating enzyme E2 S